jgi:hypothetical protein
MNKNKTATNIVKPFNVGGHNMVITTDIALKLTNKYFK